MNKALKAHKERKRETKDNSISKLIANYGDDSYVGPTKIQAVMKDDKLEKREVEVANHM